MLGCKELNPKYHELPIKNELRVAIRTVRQALTISRDVHRTSKQCWEKFLHSPILHYTFSSWIEKTMTKQYIAIGKTDLFYSSMGLCDKFYLMLSYVEF